MRTSTWRLAAVVTALLFGAQMLSHPTAVSFGRVVAGVSLKDMNARSDLVVIAEAIRTEDTTRLTGDDEIGHMLEVETSFETELVLKGPAVREFKMVHARLILPGRGINEPELVTFNSERPNHSHRQLYMLFLAKRPDGLYEAVTGQLDPVLSVREMYRVGERHQETSTQPSATSQP